MLNCYYQPYQRRFKVPLKTSHGLWEIRQGIIIRLSDSEGNIGCGEIAPLSWFGSETWQQAWDFCQQLPPEITPETIYSIPSELPACQFGFGSAWETMTRGAEEQGSRGAGEQGSRGAGVGAIRESPLPENQKSLKSSGLLPAGAAAIQSLPILWHQGYRTFKWKISILPIETEISILHQLIANLPPSGLLRLDANGGLNSRQAKQWLRITDAWGDKIEFIEQPLPINQLESMFKLRNEHTTPLALDESVATIAQMAAVYHQGWRGIFVVKPSIAGFPWELRHFCQNHQIDAVFSSVFETEIGYNNALQLAADLKPQRAVGFGVNHWFEEEQGQL
ncbi:MAG TPA: o-succinylbenzoate synthase [Oscillatoriaceae cyanobacterium M33_DOE_052]|uniref:o-succinylbenzoate synthase n=1 Tax=Planktothricoides sp. SpSt-374 TaxID=2282167 RepID=A0A7C4A0Y8_9CYAN|nr:o-succinylbenzoate synthase [Oscillatoriaceae cyanobacterium M33_DOE_052]